MDALRDADIDSSPLEGRRVAIIGYGNQGRAQALNLKDSGIDIVVGLRDRSANRERAEAEGLRVLPIEAAVSDADLTMLLVPDEVMTGLYRGIEPLLRNGAALGFSHGLAIRFGFIIPRPDLDVILIAPKGPGTALRSLYVEGRGMKALYAATQDRSGRALDMALAYGKAIGSGRAGLLPTSFAEECEADLFNEQAVVWGGVPELLVAGFDTLVEAGFSPEAAYMECVGELKLLADLIEARGIAGMREAISNTAELGGVIGGPRVVDDAVRQRMRDILSEIREGRFASQLAEEEADGYPLLRSARATAKELSVEKARRRLLD